MCGFVGIFGQIDILLYKKIIGTSLNYIKHRGPDSRSQFINNDIALGFQRLSIQDLSKKGNQPMFDTNKRYVIVFNGEIYNFQSLRNRLSYKGYKFNSKTDTEVLLNLYIEYKEKCLNLIEGMFSFCIYDKIDKSIFLARDNFGIKPLYYINTKANKLIFGSEIKSFFPFIKTENLNWQINSKKLSEQITFRSIAGNNTLITDVKKLNPGEYLYGRLKKFQIKKYFNLEKLPNTFQKNLSKTDFLNIVDKNLDLSVKKHLISDAPVGVALSGGLDSSLITNYIFKKQKKIRTFSINFLEKERTGSIIDESAYIEYIKHKYKTNHKSLVMTEKEYKKKFLKCIWHNDEPINFPHTPGIFLLSKLAKENNVKVLLGGEGADELFAGYDNFLNQSLNKNFLNFSSFNNKNNILDKLNKNFNIRSRYISKLRGNNQNKKIIYSILTYLQSIENRLDKMSMANSVEFRVPFIDKKLLELSLMNNKYKFYKNNKFSKFLLRRVAEKYFNKNHIYRPKVGFSVPINNWLRNRSGLGEYVEILSEKKTLERSIYKSNNILSLIKNFYKYPNENHISSNAGKIWNILNLELWIRTFIEKKSSL